MHTSAAAAAGGSNFIADDDDGMSCASTPSADGPTSLRSPNALRALSLLPGLDAQPNADAQQNGDHGHTPLVSGDDSDSGGAASAPRARRPHAARRAQRQWPFGWAAPRCPDKWRCPGEWRRRRRARPAARHGGRGTPPATQQRARTQGPVPVQRAVPSNDSHLVGQRSDAQANGDAQTNGGGADGRGQPLVVAALVVSADPQRAGGLAR